MQHKGCFLILCRLCQVSIIVLWYGVNRCGAMMDLLAQLECNVSIFSPFSSNSSRGEKTVGLTGTHTHLRARTHTHTHTHTTTTKKSLEVCRLLANASADISLYNRSFQSTGTPLLLNGVNTVSAMWLLCCG